jgi:hypothetical protein
MKKCRPIYLPLTLALLAVITNVAGCAESSFDLASDSRLPKWFTVTDGTPRGEFRVTMDYYSYPNQSEAVFSLYKKGNLLRLKKVTGLIRKGGPIKLKNPPAGFPEGRPIYEVITVDGVADIIEHRIKGPIFYVTDDPDIWKEIGVEQK